MSRHNNVSQDYITVTLSGQDFLNLVAESLSDIVREPYETELKVLEISTFTDDEREGWYIKYEVNEVDKDPRQEGS